MSYHFSPFILILTVSLGLFHATRSFIDCEKKVPETSLILLTESHSDFADFIQSDYLIKASTTTDSTAIAPLLNVSKNQHSQINKPGVDLDKLTALNKTNERNLRMRQKQMRHFIDRLPYLAQNKSTSTFFEGMQESEIKQSVEAMIQHAKQYKGTPYLWGGTTSKGFDCSGFTCEAYKAIGIKLPHSSHHQSKLGKVVSLKEAKPGDMVFFGKKANGTYKTNHTGIIVENKAGRVKVIHSSRRGVVVDNIMKIGSYSRRFLFVKRIL